MKKNLFIITIIIVFTACSQRVAGGTPVGLVTWVLPDGNSPVGMRIDSVYDAARIDLFVDNDPELKGSAMVLGRPVKEAKVAVGQLVTDISECGWRYIERGLLEGRNDSDILTVPIKVKVSKLYPGAHKVYLRYWAKPFERDAQLYLIKAALKEVGPGLKLYDHKADNARLVSGKGGFDDTVYEVCLGTVGSDEKPATELNVRFGRYIWSKTCRFAAIRIETSPSVDISVTDDSLIAEEEKPVRSLFMQNGPKSDSGQVDYGVKVVSGMVKVRPKSFATLQGQPLTNELHISAVRGEWESRQVVIFSPDKDLKDIELRCSDLKSVDNGKRIKADNIMFAPVGFIKTDFPYDLKLHGYWPDPILPFLKNFEIKQGDVQAIWYRVYIPAGTARGTYRGYAKVSSSNAAPWKVPVTVKVWDFDLPKMSNFRFVTNHSPGGNRPSIAEDYLFEYKLNPGDIYRFKCPTEEELKRWAAGGITAFNVRYIGTPNIKLETLAEDLEKMCQEVETCLKTAEKYGIRDKAYLYMFDETYQEEWFAAMSLISRTLKERFPDLLLLTTAREDKTWGESRGIKIDGWCPLLERYEYKAAQEARKTGKEIWYYTCLSPLKPYANIMLPEAAIDHRLLMGFMSSALDVDGFLYWTIFWQWGDKKITSGPYTDWPMAPNGSDGQLAQRGPNGPLPSIRLENIRDGLEDYDYLFIAQAKMKELTRRNITSDKLKELEIQIAPLFAPGNEVVGSLVSYTQNTTLLENKRRLVAEYILLANKFLSEN